MEQSRLQLQDIQQQRDTLLQQVRVLSFKKLKKNLTSMVKKLDDKWPDFSGRHVRMGGLLFWNTLPFFLKSFQGSCFVKLLCNLIKSVILNLNSS